VEIRIRFDGRTPPTGWVESVPQATTRFAGWLELMSVLARALDEHAALDGTNATSHGEGES
jgi:hypothetical protein